MNHTMSHIKTTSVLLVQRHHIYTLQLSDLSSSLSHSFQLQHSDSFDLKHQVCS
jgi:hypothetical protein